MILDSIRYNKNPGIFTRIRDSTTVTLCRHMDHFVLTLEQSQYNKVVHIIKSALKLPKKYNFKLL